MNNKLLNGQYLTIKIIIVYITMATNSKTIYIIFANSALQKTFTLISVIDDNDDATLESELKYLNNYYIVDKFTYCKVNDERFTKYIDSAIMTNIHHDVEIPHDTHEIHIVKSNKKNIIAALKTSETDKIIEHKFPRPKTRARKPTTTAAATTTSADVTTVRKLDVADPNASTIVTNPKKHTGDLASKARGRKKQTDAANATSAINPPEEDTSSDIQISDEQINKLIADANVGNTDDTVTDHDSDDDVDNSEQDD